MNNYMIKIALALIVITNSAEYDGVDIITKFAIEQKPFVRVINKTEDWGVKGNTKYCLFTNNKNCVIIDI